MAFSGTSQRNLAKWSILQAQGERERNDAIANEAQANTLAALGKGVSDAVPHYQGAIDRFDPWASQGLNAFGMLGDSYGLNGAAGNDNAVSAFRASPGYQYNVDQSTDAVARKQSALGMLGSGNTATAIQDRAHSLADQEYRGWQSGLKGIADIGYNATGQQAGLQRGIGDLYADAGRNEAGTYATFAGMRMGNNNNYLNNITQSANSAGKAGQDAMASNLNFGLGVASTAANLFGSAAKAGMF